MSQRCDIYNSVIQLYRNGDIVKEYPFHIEFQGEIAVDIGGVSRDMFSAFFDEMYLKLFDGSSLVYPAMNSSIEVDDFRVIGMIVSHSYLTCGVLPDRVAFPCLSAVFLGKSVPDSILLESYIASLCDYDLKIMQRALAFESDKYPSDLFSDVVTILSASGCRETPTPQSLKRLLTQCAKYSFEIKPAAALNCMRQGIPTQHVPFWESMSIDSFYSLYKAMSISVSKVQNLLDEPEFQNSAEEEVWLFLRKFIGNMSVSELRAFLRFVTGSVVICVKKIYVAFNNSVGLARCPIAHTCTSTLELSSTYNTLPEFENEFRSVLSDPIYSWRMDSI